MIGVLVASKMATLKELCEDYSIEDALDLMEIWTVQQYNEWVASEEAKNNGNRS